MSGVLRVVATPLGNLADASPRVRDALATCDALAAEDTRRTGQLLRHLGVGRKPIFSYYAPKERAKVGPILKRLKEGKTIALVTDGGTPGISDPGAVLVAAAHREGVRVEPVPGPCAVAMALSVSSFSGERFVFEGFLPARAAARRKRLVELQDEKRTIVFYESPRRLATLLGDMSDIFGSERLGTIVREGTKLHEEVREGTLGELAHRFAEGARGEVVLVLEGSREESDRASIPVGELLDLFLDRGESPERAARNVAELTGWGRTRLTRIARSREAG